MGGKPGSVLAQPFIWANFHKLAQAINPEMVTKLAISLSLFDLAPAGVYHATSVA